MAKKAIAAMLLVALMAWAEMALAPMLAMQAGHMRPGHEMAADMPPDHSAHHHAAMHHAAQATEAAHTNSALPCCPGVHTAQPEVVLQLSAGPFGCDDPRSCCFQQGPQSIPVPARDVQNLTRDMTPVVVAEVDPAQPAMKRPVRNSDLVLSPPPDLLGMTLRV
jgi:hypothetical protein